MDGTQLFMSAGRDSTAHFLTLREITAAQVAAQAELPELGLESISLCYNRNSCRT